jgi:hypothetical protein
MIPNLNFYDIYGYLIPGLTLAIVLRLPYGLITGSWPESSWTSALIAVVIGYVLGTWSKYSLGMRYRPQRWTIAIHPKRSWTKMIRPSLLL